MSFSTNHKIAGTVYSDTIHQSFLPRLKIGVRVYCPYYFFALCFMINAETLPIETLKPSLDVGIIVSDIDKAKAFYGDVLGLKQTAILPMPDGSTMYRYQTGTSTVKLRAVPKAAKYSGAVHEAVGFRLLTFYLDDFDGILKRWAAGGGEPPKIMDAGTKFTFITDPVGNQIELVKFDSGRMGIGPTDSTV